MLKTPVVIALVLAAASTAQSQTVAAAKPHFEFIVNSGTMVPTGAQRDAIKRGKMSAAQLSYAVNPAFAITTSFGWGRTRDLETVDAPKLDLFTYDIGAEVRAYHVVANKSLNLTPFAGAGVGGRTYNHRSLDIDATHDAAAYASAGGELGIGERVKLRVEARDYVNEYVSIMAGLRLKVR